MVVPEMELFISIVLSVFVLVLLKSLLRRDGQSNAQRMGKDCNLP